MKKAAFLPTMYFIIRGIKIPNTLFWSLLV